MVKGLEELVSLQSVVERLQEEEKGVVNASMGQNEQSRTALNPLHFPVFRPTTKC